MNKLFLFSLFLLSGATHAMQQNAQSPLLQPDQHALFRQQNRACALLLAEKYGIKTSVAFLAIVHIFDHRK